MKRIDSDALGILTKALGLTGAGSQLTELADGVVDQALDVVPIVRRGRVIGASEGLFTAIMRNVHTDAETLTTGIGGADPHVHAFEAGDANTAPGGVDDHTHSLTAGATETGPGGPDEHTHSVPVA